MLKIGDLIQVRQSALIGRVVEIDESQRVYKVRLQTGITYYLCSYELDLIEETERIGDFPKHHLTSIFK